MRWDPRGYLSPGPLARRIRRRLGNSCRRRVVQLWELAGQDELTAINQLCRRNTGVFLRRSAQAKQGPREMVQPGDSGLSCLESFFQSPVCSFDHPIGLWMIGCRRSV